MSLLKLDPAVAARLVDLLSTDDGYREHFVKDTATALFDIGHIADIAELQGFIQTCFFGVVLADKHVIAEARDEILKMLTRGGHQSVPALDANQPRNRKLHPLQSHAA